MIFDQDTEQHMRKAIPVGALFEHYKGKLYRVLALGRHSEEEILYVIYQAEYEDPAFGNEAIWVRPAWMFLEEIEFEGKKRQRFARVEKV